MGITDYLKLHRADALLRIRRNVFALLLLVALSTLVPRIPSLPTALAVALSSRHSRWRTSDRIYTCGSVVLLSLNILQAMWAVNYPRAPPPPSPSPAKAKQIHITTPTPKRSFRLSPNVRVFDPAAGNLSYLPVEPPTPKILLLLRASGSALQSSTSSTYPSSPLSTPSRVLNYSLPASSSTSTFMSSTGSINTPSPILSTYLGKHGGSIMRVRCPFDGAFLAEIRNHSDSEEE
ncbi:hypothetical protein K438DRAFT_2014073 [Mycena galopus ATCC 62051]|nr:hypothetical protein K438DRAFT_2014073 [Mycena galopus ATCC 62051]